MTGTGKRKIKRKNLEKEFGGGVRNGSLGAPRYAERRRNDSVAPLRMTGILELTFKPTGTGN